MGGKESAFANRPKGKALKDGVIIFLHGCEGTGQDLRVKLSHFGLNKLNKADNFEWIFPTAPLRYYTLSRTQSRVWFDRKSFQLDTPEDKEGIAFTTASLLALIEKKRSEGYHLEDIYVGGFEMGGEASLYLLRYCASCFQLGGIFAISSFLPKCSLLYEFFNESDDDLKCPPVLLMNGARDSLVPISWAESTYTSFPKYCNIEFAKVKSDHEIALIHGRRLMDWIIERRNIDKSYNDDTETSC